MMAFNLRVHTFFNYKNVYNILYDVIRYKYSNTCINFTCVHDKFDDIYIVDIFKENYLGDI